MSVAETDALRMTLTEFLDYEGEGDTRYELIDGIVVAMAPGSPAHATLIGRLAHLIGGALSDRPKCRLLVGGGVTLPARDDTYLVPDLMASCRPLPPRGQLGPDPELVIEVLWPSTEAKDRKIKLSRYREIASMREIMLVDQDEMFVEIHRRRGETDWAVDLLARPDDRLTLASVGLDTTLAVVYEVIADLLSPPGADAAAT